LKNKLLKVLSRSYSHRVFIVQYSRHFWLQSH